MLAPATVGLAAANAGTKPGLAAVPTGKCSGTAPSAPAAARLGSTMPSRGRKAWRCRISCATVAAACHTAYMHQRCNMVSNSLLSRSCAFRHWSLDRRLTSGSSRACICIAGVGAGSCCCSHSHVHGVGLGGRHRHMHKCMRRQPQGSTKLRRLAEQDCTGHAMGLAMRYSRLMLLTNNPAVSGWCMSHWAQVFS